MALISEVVDQKEDLIVGSAASHKSIQLAEEKLRVKFAADYKEYLMRYGVVSFEGREFTGITPVKRLDVVEITIEERSRDAANRADMYVIEQTGMDDIVIWQDESGNIYQTYGIEKPEKICDSLVDYFLL